MSKKGPEETWVLVALWLSKPFGKVAHDVEVLRDVAQLWLKADQNGQHWMKGFLEMLMEYSLGHLEGDTAAQALEAKLKKFAS
jgi:hypothetical protein